MNSPLNREHLRDHLWEKLLDRARQPDFREKYNQLFSRRALLAKSFNGLGALGLAATLGQCVTGAEPVQPIENSAASPLTAKAPHFPASAKRVIHLWMNGAPSQVDTFDPKPALIKYAGQRPESTVKLTTENATGGLMPSPFSFLKARVFWDRDQRTVSTCRSFC